MEEIKATLPLVKHTTYTESIKNAIYKHRANNLDAYNERQRDYYNKSKQDEEWYEKFKERCRKNNKAYRDRKNNGVVKKKGRPPKNIVFNSSMFSFNT